jgi:hypothetical protein
MLREKGLNLGSRSKKKVKASTFFVTGYWQETLKTWERREMTSMTMP